MSSAVTPVARVTTLAFHSDMSFTGRNRLAVADVREGFRLWRLAWSLGWLDIRLRYRGSMLGPLWLTISTGVMVGALGFLYSTLFKMDIHDYLPFLALSQVLWFFLSATVSEACTSFTEGEAVIRSVRMPFTVFAIRTLIRNVAVLGHNLIVVVVVFAYYGVWPGFDIFLALPGVALWIVNALALNLLLGSFCARFRDIQPIINSIMQIAFFLTPVIWKPEQIGHGANKLVLSPFFDLLEVVRTPLLGGEPSVLIWVGALVYSAALWATAWLFFVRARGRIAFWL
ncbi:MAG: ABC transporter permease [Acetobacteraceae bacterium]